MTTMTPPLLPVVPQAASPPAPAGPMAIEPMFRDATEWLASLGDVPLSRIVFDPWPGTATEADLLRLTYAQDRACELIDGTLVEKPVGYLESLIAGRLITFLNIYILPRNLGLVSGEQGMMRLSTGRIRMPDVAYVSFDRLPGRRPPTVPVPLLSPDLMAEVLSESNTRREIELKRREFIATGTRLIWVFDPPTRTVSIFTSPDVPDRTLSDGDTLDGGDVLPGFTVPVTDVFGPVPTSNE